MRLVFRGLIFLIVAGGVGLVGFAYFGDLSPEQREISRSVTLNVQ